jgi:hypothetical protein
MLWWATTKRFVEHSIAFSSDSLHVLGSVIVLLGAAILLRKPLSSIGPWLVVLALTCLNEFIDLRFPQWPDPAMNWGESTKDLILSMALPTLILVAARLFPRLWASGPETGKSVEVQGFTSDR